MKPERATSFPYSALKRALSSSIADFGARTRLVFTVLSPPTISPPATFFDWFVRLCLRMRANSLTNVDKGAQFAATPGAPVRVAGALLRIGGEVCAVELKMPIAGIRLLRLHGRAGWRDSPSPPERSESPRGRRDCADRSRRSPGVWTAGPPHPLR